MGSSLPPLLQSVRGFLLCYRMAFGTNGAVMRWTHLVTLMDAEAARQERRNDHPAAILLREGADALRRGVRPEGGIGVTIDPERRGNAPFKGALTPDLLMRDRVVT